MEVRCVTERHSGHHVGPARPQGAPDAERVRQPQRYMGAQPDLSPRTLRMNIDGPDECRHADRLTAVIRQIQQWVTVTAVDRCDPQADACHSSQPRDRSDTEQSGVRPAPGRTWSSMWEQTGRVAVTSACSAEDGGCSDRTCQAEQRDLWSVGGSCHPARVVAEEQIARIPVGNLRVSHAEFAAVWASAERRSSKHAEKGSTDWYAGAVALTCRWLAGAAYVSPRGLAEAARSPITFSVAAANEELIEREFQAAELLKTRDPRLAADRPGWCEGIQATLRWAWRRQGPPPLDIHGAADGHGRSARS